MYKSYKIHNLEKTKQMRQILKFMMLVILTIPSITKAQDYANKKAELPIIYIAKDLSVHFRSPEQVQYVDISTNDMIGDIPVENIVRIKFFLDSAENKVTPNHYSDIGVITIVGQSFIAQYRAIYLTDPQASILSASIEIRPEHMKPLDFPEITMTNYELKHYSYQLFLRKPTWNNVSSKSTGMEAHLNNIYSMGDYIFLDLSFKNNTNIKYDIDQLRFKIEDKKIVKATNVQEIEVVPLYKLNDQKYFKKNFRNIYVFKKFTYPNGKVLNVQLTEDQISGRKIELKIDYKDLLNADSL